MQEVYELKLPEQLEQTLKLPFLVSLFKYNIYLSEI